jgi:hypothetical protein
MIEIMTRALREQIVVLLGIALVGPGQLALAQGAHGQVEGRVTCNDGNVPTRGASVQLVPLASLLPTAASAAGAS